MKRKTIIWIASITYFVLSVSIIFITTKYVERKSDREYLSAIERFHDFFGNKKVIVSVLYSGEEVSCKPIPIPRNPQLFLKPYDEVKVTIANDIYEKIISTPVEDKYTLKELRKEATNKLGVVFIDNEKKKDLLAASNPKKFMKPYNAEKIRIANQLFSKLQNECIDVDDFEIIEQEIKNKLYIK